MRYCDIPSEAYLPAATLIFDYSVALVLNNQLVGSGTLVEVRGTRGILTAHHVADLLSRWPDDDLGIVIATHAHAFYVPQKFLHRVTIGRPARGGYTSAGPDLAFLRILDPFKINTIASKKSFSQLERRPYEPYMNTPLEGLSWMVCGAPSSDAKPVGEHGEADSGLGIGILSGLLIATDRVRRGAFDFLTLLTVRDRDNYPLWYGGVSGGGIWLVPLKVKSDAVPATIHALDPVFAGVAFYEETAGENMQLFAHGPESIYSPETLDSIAGNRHA